MPVRKFLIERKYFKYTKSVDCTYLPKFDQGWRTFIQQQIFRLQIGLRMKINSLKNPDEKFGLTFSPSPSTLNSCLPE
jgi:hypothetical protein